MSNTVEQESTGQTGAIIDTGPMVKTIYNNIESDLIVTTEDKVKICLHNHLSNIEKRNGWRTPLGIFATIIVTFVTTSFNDVIFVAATWMAIFFLSALISFVWLINSVYQASKSESPDIIIEELKNSRNS